MIEDWHKCVREARRLLELSQLPDTSRTHAIKYLYESVVALTQALRLLDTPDEDVT